MKISLEPPPKRIVVKEVNWLGDLVMSLPALRAVRDTFPAAHLAVLVKRELAGFFDGNGWVDEILPYSSRPGLGLIADRIAMAREIRSRRFDLAILFPNSFDSAFWMTLGGVPVRAGYTKDGRGPMLTHKASAPPDALNGHQVHYWLAMLRTTLGISGDPNNFELKASPNHIERMRTWLDAHRRRKDSSIIAIAPAAAFGPAKEWPAMHFVRLIDDLEEKYNIECVLVGARGERPRCDQIAAASKSGAMVAAGETGVGELIALLALADGFIGNDSGAMHVASALGRPTVGIFGSTNPERTGPMGAKTTVLWRHLDCSPCLERTCRFGHYNCLKEIAPRDAIDALASLCVIR
jgi:heptosyltransferase-2